MAHKHTAAHEQDHAYTGRVTEESSGLPTPKVRAAAGGIEREQTCSCGATRWIAINGDHEAATDWYVPGEET